MLDDFDWTLFPIAYRSNPRQCLLSSTLEKTMQRSYGGAYRLSALSSCPIDFCREVPNSSQLDWHPEAAHGQGVR